MTKSTKPLPPYARRWIEEKPSAGLWVALGPRAWEFAESKPFPVLVLPSHSSPGDYRWPKTSSPALVFESGDQRDSALDELVKTLIYNGTPSVVAIRESLMRSPDCCRYYEAVPYGE